MPNFNVLPSVPLSLYTHVIVNHLNLKYIRRSEMAEWLTHLTPEGRRGHPVRVSLDPSYKLSTPGYVNVCLGVSLACYSQRFEDKRTTRNSQLHCLH